MLNTAYTLEREKTSKLSSTRHVRVNSGTGVRIKWDKCVFAVFIARLFSVQQVGQHQSLAA